MRADERIVKGDTKDEKKKKAQGSYCSNCNVDLNNHGVIVVF